MRGCTNQDAIHASSPLKETNTNVCDITFKNLHDIAYQIVTELAFLLQEVAHFHKDKFTELGLHK